MINSFLSLNLAFTVVVFISTLFLFVGIFYSKKKVSLNTYLVSDRNEGAFSLSATLIASSLGAWILFGPPTAATWGGFGSVIGYALGTAFPMILLIFFQPPRCMTAIDSRAWFVTNSRSIGVCAEAAALA